MNNMYINTEEIRNTITKFNSKINDIENIFKNIDDNVRKIDGTDIWDCELQRSYTKKYNELSQHYDEIISSLNYLVKFMDDTAQKHDNYEASLQRNMENNNTNLNVNS